MDGNIFGLNVAGLLGFAFVAVVVVVEGLLKFVDGIDVFKTSAMVELATTNSILNRDCWRLGAAQALATGTHNPG